MKTTFEFLKDERINKVDTYQYKLNIFNENISAVNDVVIIFKDGKFLEVNFNFGRKMYNRLDWKSLKAIEEKITELEKNYN